MIADEYATAAEAAAILGVERQTIARWVKDGKLAGEKVGREVLIPRTQLTQTYKSSKGRKPLRPIVTFGSE